MKSSKVFNNISEELKKKIPKLKPGEIVTFQMLNGTPNPDPDPKEQQKEPVIYGKRQLRTSFRVYDEFKNPVKNQDGTISYSGEYVDVGAVERWDGERPDSFIMFVPGMGEHSRFSGKFSLTGGRVKDEELYEILWLSPEREGTPCPDAAIPPLFRILNLKEDSKRSTTMFDTLSEAIGYAKELKKDPARARAVMAALNQPTYQDDDVLFSKIGDLARTKPETFIATYKSPETETMGVLRKAIDSGILDHDIVSGKVNLGGVQITILKLNAMEELLPALTRWVNSATNGKDVLANIKKQLDKKQEGATV